MIHTHTGFIATATLAEPHQHITLVVRTNGTVRRHRGLVPPFCPDHDFMGGSREGRGARGLREGGNGGLNVIGL